MNPPTFSVVMLAGSLRPSVLQQALGRPPLCLPIDAGGSLLARWSRLLGRTTGHQGTLVIANRVAEREAIGRVAASDPVIGVDGRVSVLPDPAEWRGMAGLLRDVADRLPPADLLLAIEAHCLPPASLDGLLQVMAGDADGVVAAAPDGEPAGLYGLSEGVVRGIRDVGYVDLKEQLLPELHGAGRRVLAWSSGTRTIRLRDREGYLAAVREAARRDGHEGPIVQGGHAAAGAADEPRLLGATFVERGARLEPGAVVQDSIVLSGASVARGAVVSRSILGPGAAVAAGDRILARILTRSEGTVVHGSGAPAGASR